MRSTQRLVELQRVGADDHHVVVRPAARRALPSHTALHAPRRCCREGLAQQRRVFRSAANSSSGSPASRPQRRGASARSVTSRFCGEVGVEQELVNAAEGLRPRGWAAAFGDEMRRNAVGRRPRAPLPRRGTFRCRARPPGRRPRPRIGAETSRDRGAGLGAAGAAESSATRSHTESPGVSSLEPIAGGPPR